MVPAETATLLKTTSIQVRICLYPSAPIVPNGAFLWDFSRMLEELLLSESR